METWTEEEDQALMVAVGRGKRPAWKSIARDILGKKRSRHACRNRYRYLLARTQQRKKKGKKEGGPGELSPLDVGDSDSELTDSAARLLLELSGSPTHRAVQHSAPLTPPTKVTLAMSESEDEGAGAHIDDDGAANTEAWTPAEDAALLDAVARRGRHAWTWISSEVKVLKGRSKNSVRNRYRRLVERGGPDRRLAKAEAALRGEPEEDEEDDEEDGDDEEESEEGGVRAVAMPAFDLNAGHMERLRRRR